jgi:hypothetical protein
VLFRYQCPRLCAATTRNLSRPNWRKADKDEATGAADATARVSGEISGDADMVWVIGKGDSCDPFTQDDAGRTPASQLFCYHRAQLPAGVTEFPGILAIVNANSPLLGSLPLTISEIQPSDGLLRNNSP